MSQSATPVDSKYALRLRAKQSVTDLDPNPPKDFKGGEERAREKIAELRLELATWQERLAAESAQKLLVVLQAMDTGGKDGTIRNVFASVNAMGVETARFEVPSKIELAHDYLWRAHAVVPAKGQIGIFNRSHYEDVLAVRVNKLVPKSVWRKRYEHIRGFESMLSDEGTRIVKCYLHIDKDEQKERLQARLDDPAKLWKFNTGDLTQRKLWDDYMEAYTDAIHETDRDVAPWYVIPANKKWYRDLTILKLLIDTLQAMNPQYPKPDFDPATIKID